MSSEHKEQSSFSLENFEGPLAFLLYLVQKSELSISEVSLKEIIRQYIDRITEEQHPDLDNGAEFVSTTASLMWLKSKMLLPSLKDDDDEEFEEDSPFAIIPQLLEYCRFKEISKDLRVREEEQQTFYSRGEDPTYVPSKKLLGIERISLHQLAELFEEILKKSQEKPGTIKEEEWRVADKIALYRQKIKEQDKIPFFEVFSTKCCKNELIVTFLAILELMKLQEVCVVKEGENYLIVRGESHE